MSDYGTTWKSILRAAVANAVIVTPFFVLAAGLGCSFGWLLLVSPAYLAFPAAAALRACFRLRVKGVHVEQVFLGHFVFQRRRLAKFATVDDVMSQVIFEDGKRLHVPGALSADEWERMEVELTALSLRAQAAEQAGCAEPPRPVKLAPEWLAWNDGAVERIARALEAEQSFAHLGILADALEDAGCYDDVLLSHLRSPGPHVSGCWALDAVLARK
jgi:hypothetical protein